MKPTFKYPLIVLRFLFPPEVSKFFSPRNDDLKEKRRTKGKMYVKMMIDKMLNV